MIKFIFDVTMKCLKIMLSLSFYLKLDKSDQVQNKIFLMFVRLRECKKARSRIFRPVLGIEWNV